MNRITFTLLILLASACCLVSCNDKELLTENPKYFYTLDNVFSTSAQVDLAVVSCYSKVRKYYTLENDGKRYLLVWRGGNGTDMFDVSTIRRSLQFNDYGNLTPDTGDYKTIYADWYKLIASANLALYGASLEEISWDSEENRLYTIAQARFFRAYAYRNLGEEFGGVPLVTELTTTPRYDFVRESRLDTYQYAIDELEAILPDLPLTPPERGRIVRGAAQHNLVQLYIDKGVVLEAEGRTQEAQAAYSRAIEYGNEVIDGGVFHLMTERFGTRAKEDPKYYYDYTPDENGNLREDRTYASAGVRINGNVFWDLFQIGNQDYADGNYEAIWTIEIDYQANLDKDGASRLNFSRSFGPCFRDILPNDLIGLTPDVGGRAVTWIMPTAYTRDEIWSGVWSSDMRNSEACYRRTFLGNVPTSKYYGKVIPWSLMYRQGNSNRDAVDAAYTQCFPISCKIHLDSYIDDATGGNRTYIFRDDYAIRLSETILLRAEAKWRSGDLQGAANDINLIRRRAKCSYLVSSSDVGLELILDERARELMYEEIRWNTLLRMGGTVAVDRIREYAYWDAPRSASMKNFNLWPIPQTVIDTNKDAKIEQNDGWN
ncbi:MAG: RagB/SusD family nutrient uptake outer membrane protein [Bacteroidales bacterium]|nr:RagB/SusD family nutrient uptake outer membrane protein [Bacteroidales bacterium]